MSATAPRETQTAAAEASASGHEALIVDGMHCASCAARIERVLSRKPGVQGIEVNYVTQHAELTYEPGAFDLDEAGATLEKLGYQIKPVSRETEAQADAEHERAQRDWLLVCGSACRWRRSRSCSSTGSLIERGRGGSRWR